MAIHPRAKPRPGPTLGPALAALLLATALAPAAGALAIVWQGNVPGIGTPVDVALAAGTYNVTVTGTYSVTGGQPADASKVTHPTFGACFDYFPLFNLDPRIHDLTFDGGSPWNLVPSNGPNYQVTTQSLPCEASHAYRAQLVCSGGCTVVLRIWDDNYLDNSGALHVAFST